MATIKIRYYDPRGGILMVAQTRAPYDRENVRRWEAWLMDPNCEQDCRFSEFAVVAQHKHARPEGRAEEHP